MIKSEFCRCAFTYTEVLCKDTSKVGMAPTRRIDHECASVVDQGISLDAERGAVVAWAYLTKHGVSADVIIRVLSTPSSRRPRSSSASALDHSCASTVNSALNCP